MAIVIECLPAAKCPLISGHPTNYLSQFSISSCLDTAAYYNRHGHKKLFNNINCIGVNPNCILLCCLRLSWIDVKECLIKEGGVII